RVADTEERHRGERERAEVARGTESPRRRWVSSVPDRRALHDGSGSGKGDPRAGGLMFIKVCGITRASDGVHAVQQGATAIGFVFWPRSPRAVTPDGAAAIVDELPRNVAKVGVFVNESV